MAIIIEEKIGHCKKCRKTTKHHRNNSKTSGFMMLVHIVFTISTLGLWLLLVIIWKILNAQIGGWKCTVCG